MQTTHRLFLVLVTVLMTGCLAASLCLAADSKAPSEDDISTVDEAEPFDPFEQDSEDPFAEEADVQSIVADPLVGFNRAMFTFNDRLYFWVLKPVASGYRVVVPTPVRTSVKNFFYNLVGPVRLLNCLLQGKWSAAEGEFGRFVANTSVGILGLFDPAKEHPHLNPPAEDLGQTLGYYGTGNGFYIVWPLMGPSTLRDTVGRVGDWAMNPLSIKQLLTLDASAETSTETSMIALGVRTINETSFRIGDYETLKKAALDPYEAFRNAYIQNRNSKIAQ